MSKMLTLEQRKENVKKWIYFYRNNVHRFIEMHFGIKLYPYQWLDMYCMGNHTKYVGIKSRGVAKSWQAGVFAVAYGALYPRSQIVLVAECKKQAGIIIEKKIKPLREQYVNLDLEIKNIVTNNNDYQIELYNGSVIFVVALRESARGNRADLIIYEEFRRLDKDKINAIITPFKKPRDAPYLMNPKYKHLVENPREIFITSSGRDTESWWADVEKILNLALSNKSAIVLFADYLIAVKYNLKTIEDILEDKKTLGDEIFAMEYENMLIKENKDAFFSQDHFKNIRGLVNAYYPQHPSRYNPSKNIYKPEVKNGEYVVLVVDFALKDGKKNDNTVLYVMKLTPTKNGYAQNQLYMESMLGKNILYQALRIKQVWYDFQVNYLVLDTGGSGTAVYDVLTEVTVDNIRGVEYAPFTVMKHKTISKQQYEDYKQRTKGLNALPIIYPIVATQSLNSECAFLVRDLLKTNMIKLLCEPHVAEDFLKSNKSKFFDIKNDMSLFNWFIAPYYQTSALISEMCALTPMYSGNLVKLTEPSNGRKDRYTTLAYGTYFIYNVLNPKIVKQREEVDVTRNVMVVGQTTSVFDRKNTFSSSGRKSGIFRR